MAELSNTPHQPEAPREVFVTDSRFMLLVRKVAAFVPDAVRLGVAPLAKRVTKLEEQLKTLPGADGVAAMMGRLDATLRAPVRPVYDSKGILIAARRDAGSEGEAVERGEFEALDARLKALEARPSMSYRGVWTEAERNLPGDVCTHDGSMWYCWTATKDRPGTSEAWQLCVKRGRDQR